MLLLQATSKKSIIKITARLPSLLYCATSLLSYSTISATAAAAFATNSKLFGKSSPLVSGRSNRRVSSIISTRMASSSSISANNDILSQTLVSVSDAIALHSEKKNTVKFIDGSWFLKGRNGREEFAKGPRIAGAQYFDIDDISDKSSNLPHMMPPKQYFSAAMDAMNISNEDHIIVYGSKDCMFVHRAWFQIRNMGHGKGHTHLLDGSVGDWIDQGGPIESEGSEPSIPMIYGKDIDQSTSTKYQATDAQNIVGLEEMKTLVSQDNPDAIVIDARSKERYLGQVEEPRPGMRLGHMPGAKNVFFMDLLDKDNNVNKLRSEPELQKVLKDGGIDTSASKRFIVSCGSGATACTVLAALEECGVPTEQCYVYDGSWSEWGGREDTPIVKD